MSAKVFEPLASPLLLITGTRGSGKSALARYLEESDGSVRTLRAITTRAPRPDDGIRQYKYVSMEEFEALREAEGLLVETEYGGKCYGIEWAELKRGISARRRLIGVVSPEACNRLIRWLENTSWRSSVVSVFLDAANDELDRRLEAQGRLDPDAKEQRERDRCFEPSATYTISRGQVADIGRCVDELWSSVGRGGIVPGSIISSMITCGTLLDNAEQGQVEVASYDLRLGDEYYYGGKIRHLTKEEPILLIEPYDYAIVTSCELAQMPNDMAGRFDLAVGLFSQGVILSNGPQIDPGFRGGLFCLLFNTSSNPVLLKRGDHYATVEFQRLMHPARVPYEGPRQDKVEILNYLPANATVGAINELKKEFEQLRKESQRLQSSALAALAVIIAVISLFLSSLT